MDQQNNKKNFRNGDRKFDRKPSDRKPSDRKPFDKKFGDKKFEGKKFDGERKFEKKFDQKPDGKFEGRGERRFDRKPFDKKPFDKKFGDKKFEGKKFDGERKFDRKPRPEKKPAPYQPTARDVALKALKNVARENAYAAQALDRALTDVKLSDDDRRLAASIFYFTLENRLRIEKLIAAHVKTRPESDVVDILCIAIAQLLFMDKIPDHAAVDEAVKQTRRARKETLTALVNGVLRNIIRSRDAGEIALPDPDAEPVKYLSEKYSVMPQLVERLVEAYGFDLTEKIVSWTPDRHSQVIRANKMQMTDAAFEAWLDQNNLKWEKSVVPGGYRVYNAGKLSAHEGYRTGVFSMQGESSMLAAQAVQAKPGMQILDACAAPGGKTCLMAEQMKGSGRVYAWDLHEHRVELIQAASRRLGLENIRTQARDAAKKNENLITSMDAVLIDAPCSGLGVMGDKPDIKYRLNMDTVNALLPIQEAILNCCGEYVQPGGLLVYSTCTILPEENALQIERFLQNHPEFEADNNVSWLPEQLRGGFVNGMIQLLPGRDGVEGFFIARLRRKG